MAERAEIVLSASDKTRAAFQSAKRNLDGFKGSVAGLNASLGPILGTVGLIASAVSLVNFKRVVDGIDAFNDLHDATGASVENLSALEDVAERTGTSFDTVGSALLKFQNGLIDAKPGTDMAENLKAIGLNIEELKRLDPAEAFRRTAVALNQYSEDGNRALQTQALFGKQTRQTAAFLKDLAESGELVATVTTKQAEEAEKFNRQLFAVQKNITDVARAIAGDAVSALNALFTSLGDGDADFDKLSSSAEAFLVPLQAITVLGANVGFVLAGVGREIAAIAAQGATLASGNLAGVGVIREEVIADGKRARAELDDLEKRVLRLRAGDGDGKRKSNDDVHDVLRTRKATAPQLVDTAGLKSGAAAASKAASEALANLRKITDGQVKAVGDSLAAAQDEIRFGEQTSAQLYARGLETLDQYYADQDKARQDNLAAQRKATDDEIAERQRLLASPLLAGADKADDRQGIQNQIAEARAKLAAAEREAGQAAQLAVGERASAVAALRDQVAELDAQIGDLAQGSSGAAADLLDIAHRVAAARRIFFQAGAGEDDAAKKAAEYGRLLEVQLRFNEARRNFSDITNAAARAEESLTIASQTNGDNLLETEAKLGALRSQSLAEVEKLISATRALVALSPQNTDLQQYLADLELQAQRVRAALDPTKLRLDQAANDIGATLAAGLERAAFEGGKVSDMLKQIGLDVLRITTSELVTKPAATAFSNIVKGAGGQGTGENILGQLGQLVGLIPAGQGTGTTATSNASAQAAKNIESLATAAGGSADVLGQLPSLAAIPATTALGSLAGAAQIAAAALAQIGGGAAAGKSASLLDTVGSLFGGTGGGFGSGTAFGNQDMGQYFDTGGYTGNAGVAEAAGIVHGKEYVFSAPAVSRIGVGALEQLHESAKHGQRVRSALLPGYAAGGYVGRAGAAAGAGAGTPAAALQRPISVGPFNFHGPADPKTVQQAVLDGVRMAQRAGARGNA